MDMCVHEWVRNNVVVWEKYFCFYLQKCQRTYWQTTTSRLEGMHNGYKNHAAAVCPCHTMTKAAKNQNLQSETKTLNIAYTAAMCNITLPTQEEPQKMIVSLLLLCKQNWLIVLWEAAGYGNTTRSLGERLFTHSWGQKSCKMKMVLIFH